MVYLIINWILSVIGLLAVTFFVPGFRILDFGSALIAAGIVGLVSALIGLMLRHAGLWALVLSVALLGVFNTFLFRLSGLLIPGFAMNGFVPAIAGAVALIVVNIVTLRYGAALRDDFNWDEETAADSPRLDAPAAPTQREQTRTGFRNLVSSNR